MSTEPTLVTEALRQRSIVALENLLDMIESGDAIIGATKESLKLRQDLRRQIDDLRDRKEAGK